MLLTNHKPHASADDFALWKRINLIPFEMRFVDDPQEPNERKIDKGLWTKLQAESEGILAWLVQGCLDWQKDGLCAPETVSKATEEYRTDEDLFQIFIDDVCQVGPGYKVQASTFYNRYKKWMSENGLKPMSNTTFGTKLGDRNFKKRKSHGCQFYFGIQPLITVVF